MGSEMCIRDRYGASQDLMTRASLALAPYLQTSVTTASNSKSKPQSTIIYEVDWNKVKKITQRFQVIPLSIAPKGASLDEVLNGIAPDLYDYLPYGVDANDASLPGE